MITKIEVDGFKSLKEFDLKLIHGLNILVGPNGSGKTNIVLFFEFLSNIARFQIGNAISNVGGAGTIFQKIGKDNYVNKIDCKIYGSCKIKENKIIYYEYSFTINISFEKDNVYYSNQHLKVRNSSKFINNPDIKQSKEAWDLNLQFSFNEDGKSKLNFIDFNRNNVDIRFINREKKTNREYEEILKSFILGQNLLLNSIVKCLHPLTDYATSIYTDLVGGETFNIVPSKVRELEDSATPPGIKKDGAGLATTLYAMKKGRSKQEDGLQRFWFYVEDQEKEYKPAMLKKIIKFLRAANSTIKDLDVENDPFNNKLIVKITIKTGDYEAVLPLSSMSDGTIKWLTLITAILTSKTIFSIEEPENFLHPWMQAEIAKIMRNHLAEKSNQSFVLMTTHSESMLNNSHPEEIIIVDLNEGRTKAKRISNMDIIKEEISNSGFGLGHFYFSNALAHE